MYNCFMKILLKFTSYGIIYEYKSISVESVWILSCMVLRDCDTVCFLYYGDCPV